MGAEIKSMVYPTENRMMEMKVPLLIYPYKFAFNIWVNSIYLYSNANWQLFLKGASTQHKKIYIYSQPNIHENIFIIVANLANM